MKIEKLSPQVSVSSQLQPEDVSALAERGVKVIVCNRPDGEAAEQPSFVRIREAAEAQGMEAVHIPFTAGELGARHVDAFRECLARGQRIHAYCRTGNRSSKLWQACRAASAPAEDTGGPRERAAAKAHYDVVIVGAGSGGIAVAASLLKRRPSLRIALIEPALAHYYQPGWTLVGGGVFKAADTERPMAEVIPRGVNWINQAAECFFCERNGLGLADGSELHYDQLIVAAGLKLDWGAIEGLEATLGQNGVTSNYRYELAPYTWQLVQQTQRGKALFTQPPMPIKCAGAPQKALYLAADYWRERGVLDAIDVHFYNAGAVLFGVKDYVPALEHYVAKYRAELHFEHKLIRVDGPSQRAWFQYTDAQGQQQVLETSFDMLHVCPPQTAPDFIRQSALADAGGWLDVDPASLRHRQWRNVWGVGDVMNTTNAKTMAAVRKQAPVVAQNVCDVLDNRPAQCRYDGYGSCPLTVERGKIVLAEFAYGGKVTPTFPRWLNDGTQPTRLAWLLKTKVLPPLYWHGMLKGREWLTAPSSEC